MVLAIRILLFSSGLALTSCLIIPNELPTVLSLIYSNIPPLKIGQDTRFGVGFRLGPHADFQTIIELGPQTNTGQLGGESPSKRESLAQVNQQRDEDGPTKIPVIIEIKESKPPIKKATQPFPTKIPFKKIPGIDYR